MSIHKRRDLASRFTLAATVASALACWSGGAFGAEMPKELRGEWCSVDDSYSKYIK
jgi:hypothetical protein